MVGRGWRGRTIIGSDVGTTGERVVGTINLGMGHTSVRELLMKYFPSERKD